MDLRGASAESVAALTEELRTAVAGAPEKAESAADSLFAVAQAVRAEPGLRRFATDASVPDEAKKALVADVFDKLDGTAVAVVIAAVQRRWTHAGDLADGLQRLSEIATVLSAGKDGDRLSDELFAMLRTVQDNPALRDALAEPARSTSDKAALVGTLLDGRAMPATVTLVKRALEGTYGTVSAALSVYRRLAAEVHGEGVATVQVARPLTSDELERLTGALSRQYGRPVHVNVVVDPTVLGGIRVLIGDDVIDGTIASRLDDARRRLAG
jgi:F-type H+-transporting ATPase subunit delta